MISAPILEELKSIVGAEFVSIDEADLIANAADALDEPHLPEAVVQPHSAGEIKQIMQLANRELIPVTPRGGGVGYTGGCVPIHGGIVLNLTRMNKILLLDEANMYALVEPCVVTRTLMDAAEARGLFYPPDPSSMNESTLAGNVAENAGGPRCVKYGVTKHYVLGLEFVAPTGEIISTGGCTTKNVAGLDLHSLLIGSEGLLGIITKIWLRLIPKPAAKCTLRVGFPSVRAAAECVAAFSKSRITPSALELIDESSIKLIDFGLSEEARALLIIEVDGSHPDVRLQSAAVQELCAVHGGCDMFSTEDDAESQAIWQKRRALSQALMQFGNKKVNEDIVVPRSRIPELFERIATIGKKYNLRIPAFGHAGDGNIHANVMINKEDPDQVSRATDAVFELMQAAVEMGGTITGEHGVGYTKAKFMPLAFTPESIDLMKQIKRTLDPNGILNPGKMFPLNVKPKDC